MALQTLNTIKNWFRTGFKPTQNQFWDTWDSFRHKYEKVPVKDVEGLDELLLTKADKVVLNNHLADKNAHAPQVNTDWNSDSGFSQLLNKPEFKTINGEAIVGTGDISIDSSLQDLHKTLDVGRTWTKTSELDTFLTIDDEALGAKDAFVWESPASGIGATPAAFALTTGISTKRTVLRSDPPVATGVLTFELQNNKPSGAYKLATTSDFKTINGESLIGSGDIGLKVDAVGLDAILTAKNYANSSIILADYYQSSSYYQGLNLSALTGNTKLENHYSGKITSTLELNPGNLSLRQVDTDSTGEASMEIYGGGRGYSPEISFKKNKNGESSFCAIKAGDPLDIDDLTTKRYVDSQVDTKATIYSPTFTGVPTVPTASLDTNTTQVASTAFVNTAVNNLSQNLKSYKVWTAVISQSSTDIPVINSVLQNDFEGTVAVSREGLGIYWFTLEGAFTGNFLSPQNGTLMFQSCCDSYGAVSVSKLNDNQIQVRTFTLGMDSEDQLLSENLIEFRVYN
ncbi:hypothetical protein OA88_01925 [Flavobacterium sp. JRM]|nr:hypothetical protein OA88_01925 [Flavobacterium sp. JRM]